MVSYNYIHDFFRNPNIAIHPHTWRIHSHIKYMTTPTRITSTYVENTSSNSELILSIWDHLHIRGEYLFNLSLFFGKRGSPPHTWRILDYISLQARQIRITSTYVENTKFAFFKIFVFKDHLHIRGEYRFLKRLEFLPMGSPPHTWRIHAFIKSGSLSYRITSTYVENTIQYNLLKFHAHDHLHIRGEYSKQILI